MTKAKTDCFAYKPGQQSPRRKAECTALDKLYCKEGECRFYKEQQNVAPYIKSEYGTSRPSAAALIRAQGEQLRETPAEYVARICGRSDADGHNKRTASGIPE
jgi:hypothetical protein|uniref:Uncharacterized protein n=1 Tax=Siphoviridae sp. ctYcY12 TaxID=2825550 RepID=A0A8S5TTZ1_9CAUD|nr:MAG TPA: hypothetical protein [Siphoviridae sp. ctYcY12]